MLFSNGKNSHEPFKRDIKKDGENKKQNYCKVAFVYSNRLGKSSFVLPHHKLLEDVGRRIVSLRLDKKLGKIYFLELWYFSLRVFNYPIRMISLHIVLNDYQ